MSRRSAMLTARATFAIVPNTPRCRAAGRSAAGCDLRLNRAPRLAGLVDRAFVFDRRDVARIPAENDRLEHAAHDLAAPRLGHHAHEVQLPDHRDRTEFPPRRRDELVFEADRKSVV